MTLALYPIALLAVGLLLVLISELYNEAIGK